MLRRRLLSAAVIIGVMLVIVWADYQLAYLQNFARPGLLIAAVTYLALLISAVELGTMWKRAGRSVSLPIVLSGTTVMMLGASAPILWPRPLGECPMGLYGGVFLGLFAGVFIAAAFEIATFGKQANSVDRFFRHIFVFLYLSMLAGSVVPHRRLFDDNGFGLIGVIAVIATVKLSDAAAYGFGRVYGKHKLAPQISAGKTIEGALGAFVGGIVGAAIVFKLVAPLVTGIERNQSWLWIALYGIVITAAGIVGDLTESIIKRDAGCKDSSVWLPGLGGILDVIDSLIFAAPASCVFWLLFENL